MEQEETEQAPKKGRSYGAGERYKGLDYIEDRKQDKKHFPLETTFGKLYGSLILF